MQGGDIVEINVPKKNTIIIWTILEIHINYFKYIVIER